MVARYLGIIRRKTDCDIDASSGYTEKTPLSEDRQQFLEKLDISLQQWKDFCYRIHNGELIEDCMHFGCVSDGTFRRIALAASLEAAKRQRNIFNG